MSDFTTDEEAALAKCRSLGASDIKIEWDRAKVCFVASTKSRSGKEVQSQNTNRLATLTDLVTSLQIINAAS